MDAIELIRQRKNEALDEYRKVHEYSKRGATKDVRRELKSDAKVKMYVYLELEALLIDLIELEDNC